MTALRSAAIMYTEEQKGKNFQILLTKPKNINVPVILNWNEHPFLGWFEINQYLIMVIMVFLHLQDSFTSVEILKMVGFRFFLTAKSPQKALESEQLLPTTPKQKLKKEINSNTHSFAQSVLTVIPSGWTDHHLLGFVFWLHQPLAVGVA